MVSIFRRRWVCGILLVLAVLATPIALFVVNGLLLSSGETPTLGQTTHTEKQVENPPRLKILSYNIAKCFAYDEGRFASVAEVRERIAGLAKIVRAESPDLVFLSEAVTECGPCPVNQVVELAEAAAMPYWAFGENYNFGLPGFRMVGGNAILSRLPLKAVANPSLAGRKPFYVTKNNRRVLWCSILVRGREVLLASVHNDSFDVTNSEKQVEQILAFHEGKDAILAGDFNSLPEWGPIRTLQASKRFVGNFEGPATFPSEKPARRIDYVFAPATWTLIDERILCDAVSDHCAVVATFAPPP